MTDLLRPNKNVNFVMYDDKQFTRYNYQYLVVLTKLEYWTTNIFELGEWCRENSCLIEGLTVNIPNQERMVLFALRWS